MRPRKGIEQDIWAAAYGAAWVAAFHIELAERHRQPDINGSFDAALEGDHDEDARTLADAAVLQYRAART